MALGIEIIEVDHVGIRVKDPQASMAFYRKLGFDKVLMLPEFNACEMENTAGVRVNLIFNGVATRQQGFNLLQDLPDRYPGVTHIAWVIDSMARATEFFARHNIDITEGPKRIGERRLVCFIRDPDGTVLEFNELG
ncbi:VOC family protein [Shewanella corallii]|uniref:VOC family protein n=1 Tax=Shewanella corallii TaxID=560080 RepID=A0ABT0N1G9_9GAMM|nr:VOC family protein [Shewanella corallii]MCL2912274.1 VOC family protein [Shewanella corallii]